MISENNNELFEEAKQAEELIDTAVEDNNAEDYPFGFDETSDDDLIADLEALADELQDNPSQSDDSFNADVFSSQNEVITDEKRYEEIESSEELPEEEEVFLKEEKAPEEEVIPEEEAPENEEVTEEEETPEDEEVPESEEAPEEEEAPENEKVPEEEEAPEDEEVPEEEETPEDEEDPENEEVSEEEEVPENEEVPEEEEAPEDEEVAEEEVAGEEEITEDETPGPLTDDIDSLVDELEETIAEEIDEENATMSAQELLQLADELSDEPSVSEGIPDEVEEIVSDSVWDEEPSEIKAVELDNLVQVMNIQNEEAESFGDEGEEEIEAEEDVTFAIEDNEPEDHSDEAFIQPSELDNLAEVMNNQNDEVTYFDDDVDDEEDEDVKVFVKKADTAEESRSLLDVSLEQDNTFDDQLDKTIVNLPVSELLTEELVEEDIGQTSVFEPVRPQPAYGETGGRNASLYEKENYTGNRRKNKPDLFRGLAIIAGLLLAVVFISWLLSVVAFSVMGAEDTVSADEYDYSTTSTIIKPFNDDQEPEPIIIPEFTAEKLTIGDTGEMVDAVQKTLASLGYLAPDKISGKYDNATQKAVTQFQKANYLEVTGEVNRQTYSLIFDANATAPTTRTTDLPTTTETETSATETKSTSAQQQDITASASEEPTKPTSATPGESTKDGGKTEKTEKQTDAEPTKPTTASPSEDTESTTEKQTKSETTVSTKGTTASDEDVSGAVG